MITIFFLLFCFSMLLPLIFGAVVFKGFCKLVEKIAAGLIDILFKIPTRLFENYAKKHSGKKSKK